MTFAAPALLWWTLAAPLAAVVAALLWRRRLQATAAWSRRALWRRLLPGHSSSRLAATVLLLALTVLATTLALSRPRWGTVDQEVEQRGIDLVIVVDSSLSMSALDLHPSRLTAAKLLVHELVSRLPGHRVALVQSEGDGVVLAPLTLDHAVIGLLLESMQPASLPTPGTHLARGIERGLALFPVAEEGSQPVLIVVSDGEDHADDWDELVRQVERQGVRAHAIAVGTRAGSPIPVAGDRTRYKTDREGSTVITRLEPEGLRRLAAAGEGVYLEASQADPDLSPVIDSIEEMQRRHLATVTITQQREQFQWPLGAAALFLVASLLLPPFGSPASRES